MQSISISNNSSGSLLAALNSSVLSTKKKELAATDLIMQNQDTWLPDNTGAYMGNFQGS
jgi:hypothetical protein